MANVCVSFISIKLSDKWHALVLCLFVLAAMLFYDTHVVAGCFLDSERPCVLGLQPHHSHLLARLVATLCRLTMYLRY